MPGRRKTLGEFSSVQSLSCVQLFVTPWTAAHQPSLSITYSQSLFKLMSWSHPNISSSVVPFSPCLQSFPASGSLQTSQFFTSSGHSIGVSASASVLPMNTMDWLDILTVQGILKSILQHYSSKTSIFQHSAFFIVQISHPYMTMEKP